MTTEEKPRPLYLPAAPELLEEPAIGTPDAVDRLEASVRRLRETLVWWQEHAEALEKNWEALVEAARGQRDAWEQSAAQFCNNAEYYRGLVVAIGEPFGVEAKTSDDGSIQQDVLVAKVPELVDALRARVSALEDTLRLTGEQLDVIYSAGHGADVLHAVERAQQLVQAAVPGEAPKESEPRCTCSPGTWGLNCPLMSKVKP